MGKQKQHLRCRTKMEPYLFCSFWHVLANNILKMALKDKACHTDSEPAKKKKKKQVTQKVMYAEEWEEIFPVGKGNDNLHAFYCIPCKKSVSCANRE